MENSIVFNGSLFKIKNTIKIYISVFQNVIFHFSACRTCHVPMNRVPSKHSKFYMCVSVLCITFWVHPPLLCTSIHFEKQWVHSPQSQNIFGQSGSSSPYKWLFPSFCPSVCLSLLASREVSRVAIGFKAV